MGWKTTLYAMRLGVIVVFAACDGGTIEALPASPAGSTSYFLADDASAIVNAPISDASVAPPTADAAQDPSCATCAGSQCANLDTSAVGCGACGASCPAETPCVGGSCACPEGSTACGGQCVELGSDPLHCGACGHACGPEQICERGACTCPGTEVSFVDDVAPLLERSCAGGCHAGALPRAKLDLSAAASYAGLVGVRAAQCSDGRLLVQPGDPGASYLMHKLLGTNLCGGSIMPKSGGLPPAELAVIQSWICRGAQR